MKFLYLLPFIALAACRQPRIVYGNQMSNYSCILTTKTMTSPVLRAGYFPSCDERSPEMSLSWWEIDSIYEDAVVLKQVLTWRLDSLDRFEQQELKQRDPQAFRKEWKPYLDTLTYTTDWIRYDVYKFPDSVVRRKVALDSVDAWVFQSNYTECNKLATFFGFSLHARHDKLFRFDTSTKVRKAKSPQVPRNVQSFR